MSDEYRYEAYMAGKREAALTPERAEAKARELYAEFIRNPSPACFDRLTITNKHSWISKAYDVLRADDDGSEAARLRAEVARLTGERDNWKAHAISRGKRLRQARDRFINIRDELDDEVDRVYFGSLNHADQFKEEVAWLDDFTWDKIMGEPEDWDLLGALEKQKARADAAEARAQSAEAALAELREAARKLANAAARLSVAAQTTGGVAGRDEGLCAEIDRLSQPLGVVRTLIEKENGDGGK